MSIGHQQEKTPTYYYVVEFSRPAQILSGQRGTTVPGVVTDPARQLYGLFCQ
jgi:hypothetical protein